MQPEHPLKEILNYKGKKGEIPQKEPRRQNKKLVEGSLYQCYWKFGLWMIHYDKLKYRNELILSVELNSNKL